MGKIRVRLHEQESADSPVHVRRVRSRKELQEAFAIRMRVFVKEQGVPEEIELDGDDRRAVHFLASTSGKAVGAARVVMHRGNAKIGRMAVIKSYRRKGVGGKLLRAAITTALRLGVRTLYLHAQVRVIGFYERFGFHAIGPVFAEAEIPHRKMVLKVACSRLQPTCTRRNRH